MGREIRMVPPNWNHPKVMRSNGQEGYQPMFDERFEDAAKEWKEGLAKWEAGERPSGITQEFASKEFWEYEGGPPERKFYRPWKDEEATWYQVWETVSEGTPVSPPFATKQELIEYLVANGDFWDQARRKEGVRVMDCSPWTREQAEAFVNGPGWAPSLVLSDGQIQTGVQALVSSQDARPTHAD